MPKWSELEGMPVIDTNCHKVLGLAKDIFFERTSGKAFLCIKSEKLFAKPVYISTCDIGRIGMACIMVNFGGANIVQINNEDDKYFSFVKTIEKKTIISENGKTLGKILDVIFDIKAQKPPEFEISDGICEDLWQGRKMATYHSINLKNNDYLKLFEISSELIENGKGIKNLMRGGKNYDGKI